MDLHIKPGVVEQLLRDRGLSQRALADLIETDPGHLSRILSGRSTLTWEMLMRICVALSGSATSGRTAPVHPGSIAGVRDGGTEIPLLDVPEAQGV